MLILNILVFTRFRHLAIAAGLIKHHFAFPKDPLFGAMEAAVAFGCCLCEQRAQVEGKDGSGTLEIL